MRVLFVHQNIEAAGAEAAESRETIKSLLNCGCYVGLLYTGSSNPQLPGIECADFLVTDGTKQGDKRYIRKLITRFQPNIAHIKSLWTPFHARSASVLRQLNVPYIVEPGGHLNPYLLSHRFGGKKMQPHQKLARLLYHQFVDLPLCRQASGIRALSNWEAEIMQPMVRNQIKTIPLGFNREWITCERLKADFPSKDQPLRLNYLGRLDIAQKGLDLVLEAMKIIQKLNFEHRFRVRLSGPDVCGSTNRLHQIIEGFGLKNVVIESGCFGEAKLDFFRCTDIFLHLSRIEEMAKLAREAIGAGVPVMASLESNFGDWVRKEESGLVVGLNPQSVAKQLIALSEKPSLIKEMASKTLKHASEYSWDLIGAELTEFYTALLEKSARSFLKLDHLL
jgi:glycosyltransferase involved in cell wall biosynthesis